MRQKVRKTLIFISFLLFPVTMWYFSPYLIIQGMSEHILNGSFFVFVSMLVLSVFFGRIWCGWLCPAGGLQECAAATNDKPAKGGWRNGIKYGIWTVWIAAVVATYIMAKGDVKADFFYMTNHGISIADISNYIIYYGVLFILVLPSMIHGRRAACHYICWMAPFMQIGSAIGRLLHIPQPHIESILNRIRKNAFHAENAIPCVRWDLTSKRWSVPAKTHVAPSAFSAARVWTPVQRTFSEFN